MEERADKSATILEAQWLEGEIPRISDELDALKKLEQELLTTPLETVSTAYQETYRTSHKRLGRFYRRQRRVVPTRYGYRERSVEVGWLPVAYKVLMAGLVVLAVYLVFRNHQLERTQQGIRWASALLITGIALAFAPMVGAFFWRRSARRRAEQAADEARQSEAFLHEKQDRQSKLYRCQDRIAELEERLRLARQRYDELRIVLTRGNHGGGPT